MRQWSNTEQREPGGEIIFKGLAEDLKSFRDMILDTFDGKSQVIGNFTVTQALVFAADKDVARLFRKGVECSLYDGLYLLGEELLRVTGFEGRDTHVQLPVFMLREHSLYFLMLLFSSQVIDTSVLYDGQHIIRNIHLMWQSGAVFPIVHKTVHYDIFRCGRVAHIGTRKTDVSLTVVVIQSVEVIYIRSIFHSSGQRFKHPYGRRKKLFFTYFSLTNTCLPISLYEKKWAYYIGEERFLPPLSRPFRMADRLPDRKGVFPVAEAVDRSVAFLPIRCPAPLATRVYRYTIVRCIHDSRYRTKFSDPVLPEC